MSLIIHENNLNHLHRKEDYTRRRSCFGIKSKLTFSHCGLYNSNEIKDVIGSDSGPILSLSEIDPTLILSDIKSGCLKIELDPITSLFNVRDRTGTKFLCPRSSRSRLSGQMSVENRTLSDRITSQSKVIEHPHDLLQ